jgi:ribosomal protein L19
MKIIPVLQRVESFYTRFKAKKHFHKKVTKGDFISIIYFDLEKEQIRLQQFTGFCRNFKSKGLNTKVEVRNSIGHILVAQQFFLYNQSVLDVAILRKK